MTLQPEVSPSPLTIAFIVLEQYQIGNMVIKNLHAHHDFAKMLQLRSKF